MERQTHELELGLDLLQPPQAERPEAQHALNPSVGRLHDSLSHTVGRLSCWTPLLTQRLRQLAGLLYAAQ